ncbi:hypothetical protein TELCIR_11265 [Teladorsagia circumcincta]|uniref:Uncharacterized protein n=1 Tax=Teladorsagia circumcincta TaxID=45464 RepID=A0A2G9U9X4_TELCI|nr:hypothetical protein TELCIR_11265 [Teladorsagia circumcincta]
MCDPASYCGEARSDRRLHRSDERHYFSFVQDNVEDGSSGEPVHGQLFSGLSVPAHAYSVPYRIRQSKPLMFGENRTRGRRSGNGLGAHFKLLLRVK